MVPVRTDRTFRFGVMAPGATTSAEYRETAQKAEALGYSTLYVPDHFVDHPLGPIPAMTFAAAATETLRVGCLVLGNDYRHPVVARAATPRRSISCRTGASSSGSARDG